MGGGPADGTVVSDSFSPRFDLSTTLNIRLAAASRGKDGSTAVTASDAQTEADNDGVLPIRKQPEVRRISQEQLKAEVNGIYAGLVMVEKKCMTIIVPTSLTGEQYQALIELFRVLIKEHHDFLLASQHPEASPALRELPKKYKMAARMWRHGIHAFLELLRKRLPESQECMEAFVHWSYSMMSLLDETVPEFRSVWVECKGDIARYRWAVHDQGSVEQSWKYIAQEQYTRALDDNPRVGRLYHHLAILMRPDSSPQSTEHFDATVLQLFYFTKSLAVETPFLDARDSLLTCIIDPIIARTKEKAENPASVPPSDKDHFLTAVANLILASLEPELLRAHGYETFKKDHLQAVHMALSKIGRPACAERPQASRIRPSAQLGLLLCQLLLGMFYATGRLSPMIGTGGADFAAPADRTNLPASSTNARGIHDAIIAMVHTMIPYLLQEADTRDLGVWGFIYTTLVFMRFLKTRPDLREWLGGAFHAEMLAPFLNMLLREDESRGERALQSVSQSELHNLCAPLNPKESTATTEEATSHAAHKRDQDAERMYTITLPEDELLRGHSFAREADAPNNESSMGANKDIIADPCIPKATISGVKYAEGEAQDTEVQRRVELLHDPPLFPAGWFKNSKYDFDERQVRQDYVQDAITCDARSRQILCLAGQLINVFFDFRTDEKGRYWISVLGAPASMPRSNMQMPGIMKRDGGARVTYVHPSSKMLRKRGSQGIEKTGRSRRSGESREEDA